MQPMHLRHRVQPLLPTLRLWMAAQMRRPEAMSASTKPRQPTTVQATHLRHTQVEA